MAEVLRHKRAVLHHMQIRGAKIKGTRPLVAGEERQSVGDAVCFAGKNKALAQLQSRVQPDVFFGSVVMRLKRITAEKNRRRFVARQKGLQAAAVVVVTVGQHGKIYPCQIDA